MSANDPKRTSPHHPLGHRLLVRLTARDSVHADGVRRQLTNGSVPWCRHAIKLVECLLDLHGSIVQTATQSASYRRIVLESCGELCDLLLHWHEDPKQVGVPTDVHP